MACLGLVAVLEACSSQSPHRDVHRNSALPSVASFQYDVSTPTASGSRTRLLYAPIPIPTDAAGRPRIFRVDATIRAQPFLTLEMRSTLARIASKLRPTYRAHLSVLFAGSPGRQYFVVFLEGFPQYPVLNNCTSDSHCSQVCPLYVDPLTRRTVPSTIPRCADNLPIWRH
jgi:hypothetical protein